MLKSDVKMPSSFESTGLLLLVGKEASSYVMVPRGTP